MSEYQPRRYPVGMRSYTAIDTLLSGAEQALRTVFGRPTTTERGNPAAAVPETDLDPAERTESARLLRVDHTGEVCAQALYQGQALTARTATVREDLERAALEEGDHLQWCRQRIEELGGHTSVLNPAFYTASFAIGALAGALGDRWNLGFLAETERQVTRHLDGHLHKISPRDSRSRAILEQMRIDELAHAHHAVAGGAAPLPAPVRHGMTLASKVMTGTTYWV